MYVLKRECHLQIRRKQNELFTSNFFIITHSKSSAMYSSSEAFLSLPKTSPSFTKSYYWWLWFTYFIGFLFFLVLILSLLFIRLIFFMLLGLMIIMIKINLLLFLFIVLCVLLILFIILVSIPIVIKFLIIIFWLLLNSLLISHVLVRLSTILIIMLLWILGNIWLLPEINKLNLTFLEHYFHPDYNPSSDYQTILPHYPHWFANDATTTNATIAP